MNRAEKESTLKDTNVEDPQMPEEKAKIPPALLAAWNRAYQEFVEQLDLAKDQGILSPRKRTTPQVFVQKKLPLQ